MQRSSHDGGDGIINDTAATSSASCRSSRHDDCDGCSDCYNNSPAPQSPEWQQEEEMQPAPPARTQQQQLIPLLPSPSSYDYCESGRRCNTAPALQLRGRQQQQQQQPAPSARPLPPLRSPSPPPQQPRSSRLALQQEHERQLAYCRWRRLMLHQAVLAAALWAALFLVPVLPTSLTLGRPVTVPTAWSLSRLLPPQELQQRVPPVKGAPMKGQAARDVLLLLVVPGRGGDSGADPDVEQPEAPEAQDLHGEEEEQQQEEEAETTASLLGLSRRSVSSLLLRAIPVPFGSRSSSSSASSTRRLSAVELADTTATLLGLSSSELLRPGEAATIVQRSAALFARSSQGLNGAAASLESLAGWLLATPPWNCLCALGVLLAAAGLGTLYTCTWPSSSSSPGGRAAAETMAFAASFGAILLGMALVTCPTSTSTGGHEEDAAGRRWLGFLVSLAGLCLWFYALLDLHPLVSSHWECEDIWRPSSLAQLLDLARSRPFRDSLLDHALILLVVAPVAAFHQSAAMALLAVLAAGAQCLNPLGLALLLALGLSSELERHLCEAAALVLVFAALWSLGCSSALATPWWPLMPLGFLVPPFSVAYQLLGLVPLLCAGTLCASSLLPARASAPAPASSTPQQQQPQTPWLRRLAVTGTDCRRSRGVPLLLSLMLLAGLLSGLSSLVNWTVLLFATSFAVASYRNYQSYRRGRPPDDSCSSSGSRLPGWLHRGKMTALWAAAGAAGAVWLLMLSAYVWPTSPVHRLLSSGARCLLAFP